MPCRWRRSSGAHLRVITWLGHLEALCAEGTLELWWSHFAEQNTRQRKKSFYSNQWGFSKEGERTLRTWGKLTVSADGQCCGLLGAVAAALSTLNPAHFLSVSLPTEGRHSKQPTAFCRLLPLVGTVSALDRRALHRALSQSCKSSRDRRTLQAEL